MRLLPLALAFAVCGFGRATAADNRPFAIEVVDDVTGRGVPLVELETVNHVRFVTDSNGLAAIDDPDLLGRTVYFSVRSHGYEFPKDGFGFRGKAFKLEPGGKATLKLKRLNVAERLYRTTGGGIYRDSVMFGIKPPVGAPLLKAEVIGCDSVLTAVYRGKVYWFWGDTLRPHYPLGGNFHVTAATTPLPGDGGPDPRFGIDFDYVVGKDGGVRPVAHMPGDGPTWISAVTVLKDKDGNEGMYAGYVKVRNLLESYRWGFVKWNDEKETFEKVVEFDARPAVFPEPQTHTFLRREADGTDYVYFANPLPLTRVKADPTAFVDPRAYEGFTCLKADTRPEEKSLDRVEGKLRYAWKKNTPPLTQKEESALVKAGVMKADEAQTLLRDVVTGKEVRLHNGSVFWNEHRRRWLLLCSENNGGPSVLGEVWYAEADAPTGPWAYARKVVTHDKYSFYNPKHHPFFDQDGGRTIFFEGTYTRDFSGNPTATPRYDYNQIMYRLDLTSRDLNLPVAFYERDEAGPPFATRRHDAPAFFALERPRNDSVAIAWDGKALRALPAPLAPAALFHALPMNADPVPCTTPLFEFVDETTGKREYSTRRDLGPGHKRSAEPICRVWEAPVGTHDAEATVPTRTERKMP